MVTKLITRDLINTTKGTIHLLMGDELLAQSSYNLVKNVDDLPDWDDVDNNTKAELYKIAWSELRKEGYYED